MLALNLASLELSPLTLEALELKGLDYKGFTNPLLTHTFVGAWPASSTTQNDGAEGSYLNIMPKGSVTALVSNSSAILAKDYLGDYNQYSTGTPVWKGGRYVPASLLKYSNDITNVIWSKTSMSVTNISGESYVKPTATASHYVRQIHTGVAGQATYRFHVKLDSVVDKISTYTGASSSYTDFDLTNETLVKESRIVDAEIINNLDGTLTLYFQTAIDGFTHSQLRIYVSDGATGRTTTTGNGIDGLFLLNAEMYSSMTIAEVKLLDFAITNGTVSPNTFSTDTSGSLIDPHPWLQANTAVTNFWYPSESPVTSSFTVAATQHTLWIEGTGSITSSYGTATEDTPLTFIGTASSVLFTVNGSVDRAQIEAGPLGTTYVMTTASAASIAATSYTYPAANIDPADASIGINIDYKGDSVDIVDIGGVPLLTGGPIGTGTNVYVSDTGFDTPGTWTVDAGVSVASSKLTFTATASGAKCRDILIVVPAYTSVEVSFEILSISAGAVIFSDVSGVKGADATTVGTHTFIHTMTTGGWIQLRSNGASTTAEVDNFEIRDTVTGLVLSDGTNSISTPMSEGANEIGIELSATDMALDLNGTVLTDSYTPLTSGTITINEDHYQFISKTI